MPPRPTRLGARGLVLARRPLVAKLVSDPAYERARRYRPLRRHPRGVPAGRLGGPSWRSRRRGRARCDERRTIVVPSAYLAEIAEGWGLRGDRIRVLTNPAPPPRDMRAQRFLPGTFVFVGRLTRQKALDVAIDAVAARARRAPRRRRRRAGAAALERRAAALGRRAGSSFSALRSRDEALAVVAGATAAVLSSDWENLPHSAVEALSVGVPVVATAVGGVPEVVHDGENGLLVPPGRPDALAAAITPHPRGSRGSASGWPRAAKPSVAALSSDDVYGHARGVLAGGRAGERSLVLLFVGRRRYTLPLPTWLAHEVGRSRGELDYRVLGAAADDSGPSDERFRLSRRPARACSTGCSFYLRLPFRVRQELREFEPDVVLRVGPLPRRRRLLGRTLARRRRR